jgi:hypothetical protein
MKRAVLLLFVAGCRFGLPMLALLCMLTACRFDLPDPEPDSGGDPVLAECKAQRVVNIVGSNASLAWFTLVWPLPAVITGFQPNYAYDNPADARNITTEARHPLFARRFGVNALWDGLGNDPQPSAFVAGQNETLTDYPSSIVINGGTGLIAAAAVLQAPLAPKVPVLQFSSVGIYGSAPGAPPVVSASNVDAAIAALQVAPEIEAQLRPSAAQLASYIPPGALGLEVRLGTMLAFTANAFRLGLIGSVIMPGTRDYPTTAWSDAPPTGRANNLTAMLNAFYSELSTNSETSCGRDGVPLSLADNVVMIVIGDTPLNPFDVTGSWVTSTPGSANVMYVRSNGFTRPGWFGQIQPSIRTNFDPITGEADSMASVSSSTAAAWAGALYAVARGDKAAVKAFRDIPFDGVILR